MVLSAPILKNFFTIRKNTYNLRNHRKLQNANKNINLYDIKTVNYNSLQI